MRVSTFALKALLLLGGAQAHGGMNFPVTRNLMRSNYCPHCANGKGVCGNGQGSQWTTSDDPGLLHGEYETSRTVLYSGGTLEVELWWTVGHKGILTVELCDNPPERFTSDCFKRLKRDPSDVRLSPYLEEYPEIVFLLSDECMTRATLDSPAKIRFLVPESTKPSDHGILRMYWNTGNSCSPHKASTTKTVDPRVSTFETLFNGATCRAAVAGLDLCGADCPRDECGGEKFINCADVAIVQAGGEKHVNSKDFEQIPIGEVTVTTSSPSPTVTTSSPSPTTIVTSETVPSTSIITRQTAATTQGTTLAATSRPVVTTATPRATTALSSFPITTTSRAPPSTCTAPTGNEEACKLQVKGLQSWFDSYCRERCHTIGSGEDETGRRWCATKNICDLTKCVTEFYANVCVLI